MKTHSEAVEDELINLSYEDFISEFRASMSNIIGKTFHLITEQESLPTNKRLQLIEKLLKIDGLIGQEDIDLRPITEEANQLNLERDHFLSDKQNYALISQIELLKVECGNYLNELSRLSQEAIGKN